jgi:hypothetical protein
MVRVGTLGRLALVFGTVLQRVTDADSFDDEHLVLEVDVAFGLTAEATHAGVDPARLQRATQGPGQSTGRRGDDVVEGRRVIRILTGRGAVVLSDLVMGSEEDGFAARPAGRPS